MLRVRIRVTVGVRARLKVKERLRTANRVMLIGLVCGMVVEMYLLETLWCFYFNIIRNVHYCVIFGIYTALSGLL